MVRWMFLTACRRGQRSGFSEVIEEASRYAAAVAALCSRPLTAAADARLCVQSIADETLQGCGFQRRNHQVVQPLSTGYQQDQQQLPLFPRQVIQHLQDLHRQHQTYSAVAPSAQQPPQHHEVSLQSPPTAVQLPYQQAAVSALVNQLGSVKQRLSARLPPSADIIPIITQFVVLYSSTHNVTVLVSSSARAAALREQLKPVLQLSGITPRLVPGELLGAQQAVVIVDLQQLLRVPSAAIQLQQQQLSVQRGLVIYEEGFLPEDQAAADNNSSSSSSSSEWRLYDHRLRTAAEQLLRSVRYLEPHPNKLLLTLSSRGWHLDLLQQQQQQQNPASSSSSSEWQVSGYQLPRSEALSAGLIKAPAAISIPTATQIPSDLLSTAGSSTSTSSDALCTLLSSSSRNELVAAAFKAVAGNTSKGLVYAAGQHHARQLAVALNLQGISSLVLHEQQSPEDQAAVLHEFDTGNDRVLVTSIAAEYAASLKLSSCDARISCVLMAAPVMDQGVYAARLAPVLLPAAAAARVPGIADSSKQMIVIDFVDQVVGTAAGTAAAAVTAAIQVAPNPATAAAATAVAGGSQQPQTKRRRRSRTDAAIAETGAIVSAPGAAGNSSSNSSSLRPLTCFDVLGDICTIIPLPTTPAAPVSSSSSSSNRLDTLTDNLHLAPVVGQQASAAATAADQHASDQQQQQQRAQGDLIWTILDDGSWAIPIRRGRGSSMTGLVIMWLRKAKKNYVPELEEGLGQLAPLPGTTGKPINLQRARTLAEQWIRLHYPSEAALRELGLEWRERPMTDGQILFCDRHNIPYDTTWSRGTVMNTIDRFILENMHEPPTEKQLFLVKHFAPLAPASMTHTTSSSIGYKAAADNFLQALLVGQLAPSSSSRGPGKPGSAAARDADGSSSSSTQRALPARKALLSDLEALWNAGVKPKYTWMMINSDTLLLDLMSGSYLWLRPAAAAAPGSSSSSLDAPSLNPAVPYNLILELPDGSQHPVVNPISATALLTTYTAAHTINNTATTASAAAAIPSSSRPLPLPLPAAVDHAEKVVALLASHHQAFVGRAASRLIGMVGGWKVPPKSSEAQMALPASARQLELLKSYGLPCSRNYTCMDAHRELVRYMKSNGLPEPPVTANQLARIRELQLPLNAAAAASLTAGEARAMLFRVQLVEEQAAAAAARKAAKATGRARKPRDLR